MPLLLSSLNTFNSGEVFADLMADIILLLVALSNLSAIIKSTSDYFPVHHGKFWLKLIVRAFSVCLSLSIAILNLINYEIMGT